jgi:hypothetical protein
MADFASGEIDSNNLNLLMSHIEVCEKCREEFEQIGLLDKAFDLLPDLEAESGSEYDSGYDLAENYIRNEKRIRLRRFLIPAGIAASVLLFLSGFYAGRIHRDEDPRDQQIAALRDEVKETKNLMILSLLKQESASKRIQAAIYADKMDELQPDVRDALLQSLNNDVSTNVRLASLEALSKYTDNPFIRTELIRAFDQESDPIIQVNMINLMVLLNEKSSAGIMEKLVNDDNTDTLVKNQARKGLEILL